MTTWVLPGAQEVQGTPGTSEQGHRKCRATPWGPVAGTREAALCHISGTAAAAAKSLQSCPTLCDPIDGSPPGSTVPGILQARTLEWVAISSSHA